MREGNFAIARRPSRVRTWAFGRAPPSELPARREQREILVRGDIALDAPCRIKQDGKIHQCRDPTVRWGEEVVGAGRAETERPLPEVITHPQKHVHFAEGSQGASRRLGLTSLPASDKRTTPAIGGTVGKAPEEHIGPRRRGRTKRHRKCRCERKCPWEREPPLVIVEGRGLTAPAMARIDVPNQAIRTMDLRVDLDIHGDVGRWGRRTRRGSCSSARNRPTSEL